MSLHYGGGFLGEKRYQDLASLPLPGPAVVIDVRHSTQHGPELLQHVAIELEDLTTEMYLHQVYRWRNLAKWVDFLKLDPLTPAKMLSTSNSFWLTPRNGETKRNFNSPDELAAYVSGHYLDRVRNNRISAAKDKSRNRYEAISDSTSPEQSTVRVFFLVDMADKHSLSSAAYYADLLKNWNYQYDEPGRAGRDKRLQTIAISMNVDSRRLHLFTQYQSQASTTYSLFDAVILMQTYRDDEAFLDQETQLRQLELMLCTLLLHWPDNITMNGWQMRDDQDISTFVTKSLDIEQADFETQILPWPTYMMGISSLEYAARWGKRYLDYGLAAKIIEVIGNKKDVQREEAHIRVQVQDWLDSWWQQCQDAVPDTLIPTIQDLQAIATLQHLAATPPLRKSPLRASLRNLQAFRQQVMQLYTGTQGMTLERAVIAASTIPGQLKKTFSQAGESKVSERVERAAADERSTPLIDLHAQAEQFTGKLFTGARGALHRAQFQIAALQSSVIPIEEVARTPIDLEEFNSEFEEKAQTVKKQLENLLYPWRLPLMGSILPSTAISLVICLVAWLILWFVLDKLTSLPQVLPLPLLILPLIVAGEAVYLSLRNRELRRRRDAICQKLNTILLQQSEAIRSFIAADVALSLLEEADLYNPTVIGGISPYQVRLKNLEKALNEAREEAITQKDIAQERLNPAASQTHLGTIQNPTWSNLNSTRNYLPWNQVVNAFWQSCKDLDTHPESLDTLAEMLLRRLGKEKPAAITQHVLSKQQVQLQQISDTKRFHTITVMLAVTLLTLNIVGPDITNILPLLKQYIYLKDKYSQEPSVLKSIILNLQNILNDAMKEQAVPRNSGLLPPKYDQRIERILAAWVDTVRANEPALRELFEHHGIVALLERNNIDQAGVLEDLRERGRLLGYRDETTSDDRFYLFVPPGDIEAFQETLELMEVSNIRLVGFPDTEKLIYLHIHRVRQIFTGSFIPNRQKLIN